MPTNPFQIGQRYTRAQIFTALHLHPHPSGGNWFTGYHQHENGDWFIFSHVGTAGRTGHDYGDHWVNGNLHWKGKTGSRLHQPAVRSLTSGRHTVHLFTRNHDRDPFAYAGTATAVSTEDTEPVTVVWSINGAQTGSDTGRSGLK